jgi:hypothetical protein
MTFKAQDAREAAEFFNSFPKGTRQKVLAILDDIEVAAKRGESSTLVTNVIKEIDLDQIMNELRRLGYSADYAPEKSSAFPAYHQAVRITW